MKDTYKGESSDMSGTTEQPAGASLNELGGLLTREVASVLDRALGGEDITVEEATLLFDTTGPDYNAMVLVADELRRRTVGDIVTYVVNRNINFTNVCIKRCGFCAFSRDFREEEGYFLPIEEIVRRAREAWDYGATEVCIQAGLPPQMEGDLYIRLCSAIKEALPTCTSMASLRRKCFTAPSGPAARSASTWRGCGMPGWAACPALPPRYWTKNCATAFPRDASPWTSGPR